MSARRAAPTPAQAEIPKNGERECVVELRALVSSKEGNVLLVADIAGAQWVYTLPINHIVLAEAIHAIAPIVRRELGIWASSYHPDAG